MPFLPPNQQRQSTEGTEPLISTECNPQEEEQQCYEACSELLAVCDMAKKSFFGTVSFY